jgi:CubicO group peptidase (beta-lactamase class C family)
LGLVAERATGKSLKQLVSERITGPLNISGLQYGLPEGESLIPRVSGKDSLLRLAYRGELDIFGPDVPDYDPVHELYLGGEGMLATADGYADFLRMLLFQGKMNGVRVLEKATVEDIHSPHTQLDNPYGHNGYNLWVSSDSMRVQGKGDAGLWIGGGYEGTHFWVDPKREFVGVIMTQMSFVRPPGYGRDDAIRGEIYRQLFEDEAINLDR